MSIMRGNRAIHCNVNVTDPMQEQYENLANAIIVQAVRDYRAALRKLRRGRRNSLAERNKLECENFFRSKWFEILTAVDGEELIQQLNREGVRV